MNRLRLAVLLSSVCLLMTSLPLPLNAFDKGFEYLYTSNAAEAQDLPVKFDKPLPAWINGTLYHNGLGLFGVGPRNVTHFFDGFAKMHSWKLTGGSDVGYFTTKFLQSNIYNESMEMQDIARYWLFAKTDPKFKIEDRPTMLDNGMDNVNINLLRMGDDLVALADMSRLYVIDRHDLKTLKQVDAKVPGVEGTNNRLSSSHPVPEIGTKNWINVLVESNPFSVSKLHVVRFKSATEREVIATMKFKRAPYMHSFGGTDKYILLFVSPISFDFVKMLITWEPAKAMKWLKDIPNYVHIVEIATGKVKVIEAEPTFGLHFANAFAMSDNKIAVDMSTYPDITPLKVQLLEYLLDPIKRNQIPSDKALFKRYVIDLEAETVEPVEFGVNPDAPTVNILDFPVFNELYRSKKYCYVYGVTQKSDMVHMAKWSLVKKDTCDAKGDKVWYKENHYPGEPWFVAEPGAEKEDKGHVMTVVLDGEKGRSYLAIFDAESLELVNKAYLPTYLPMTIHGRFEEGF